MNFTFQNKRESFSTWETMRHRKKFLIWRLLNFFTEILANSPS